MGELFLDQQLARRLIDAERDCVLDWVRAMEAMSGNPLNAAVEQFGGATAVVCGEIPAEIWNRVFHFTPAEMEHVPAIIEFYRSHKEQIMLDLSPYTTPPTWENDMLRTLAQDYGFYHGSFHQMLYGVPTLAVPSTPAHIEIRAVTLDDAQVFGEVYEQVWGGSNVIKILIGHPNFRNYLAYVEGVPAAIGMLHVVNGAASMANGLTIPAMRGKGCQTALLHHRVRQAALEGCDLLVSQCRAGSTSQHNQQRAGLQVVGTKAWWLH